MKTFNKEKLIIPVFLIIILSFFYFMSTEKVKPENTECKNCVKPTDNTYQSRADYKLKN